MEGGRQRPREAAVLPAVRQHRPGGAGRRVCDRAGPAAARRLAGGLRAARPAHAAAHAGRRTRRPKPDRPTGCGSAMSATFLSRAAAPSSTAGPRSPSSGSPAATSGTPARTSARTSERWCWRGASSAISRASPKVACPLHKKTFSLESGACLSGEDYKVRVFPVKVEGDAVFLALPPEENLEALTRSKNACASHCAVPCA